MKYTSGARENITYLDEGFIDLSTLKTVELGYVDMLTVPKQTLLAISNCYRSSSGNSYNAHVQLSLIFGSSLHQNKVVSLFSPNCHDHHHDIIVIIIIFMIMIIIIVVIMMMSIRVDSRVQELKVHLCVTCRIVTLAPSPFLFNTPVVVVGGDDDCEG